MWLVSAEINGHEIGYRPFSDLVDALQFAGELRARFAVVHVWAMEYGLWWEIDIDWKL